MLFPILFGAAAGALFVILVRRLDPAAARRVIAIGLVAAALVYIGFALPVGDRRWLMIEAAGLSAFGAVAWLGSVAAGWLALGWMAHVVWDVALHLDRAQPLVGAWYPLGCVGFDLIVAGFVLGTVLSPPRSFPTPG